MKPICLTIFLLMGLVATSQTLVPYLMNSGKYILVQKGSMKPVSKKEYDDAGIMVNGFAIVRVNDKWGFVDSLGHEVSIKYEEVESFSYGSALVKLNDRWGLIGKLGIELVAPQFEIVVKSGKGNIWVWNNDKCGLLNNLGKELIAPKYDDYDINSFSSGGLGIVKLDGKWGYIDESGVEKIPFQYDDAYGFSDGLARVAMDGKCGYINEKGIAIIPLQYDGCSLKLKEGFTVINADGKWGFVNSKGKLVTPIKYEKVMEFSEGLAAVKMNGKWGCVDKTGKEAIPMKYEYEFEFKEGLAVVSVDNKSVYIDTKGNVVNQQYVLGDSFSEGLARVEDINYKWGYINKTGAVAIKLKFDGAGNFKNGLAKVHVVNESGQGGWGYIDKTGKEIVPLKFPQNHLGEFENGFALVGWATDSSNVFFYVDTLGVQYREGKEYQK